VNISALRANTAAPVPTTVYVQGYYGPGDGGQGFFEAVPSALADNGGTVLIDGAGTRWFRDIQGDPYDPRWFGALGNGVHDDTNAIAACITAAETASNMSMLFTSGTYAFSSELTVTKPILVMGSGMGATILLLTNLTANGLTFTLGGVNGGGLRDLTLRSNAPAFNARGSTGNGLSVNSCNQGFAVQNVTISNFDVSCVMNGCFSEYFDNVIFNYFGGKGLFIPPNVSVVQNDGRYFSLKIDNIGNNWGDTASIGIFIGESGGHFFTNIDVINTGYGLVIQPPATLSVSFCKFVECLFDTSYSIPVWLDATNGFVTAIDFEGCWAAFSTTQDGVVFQGANFESVQWIGGQVRQNAGNGFHFLVGAQYVTINGAHISANSRVTPHTFNGIEVEPGVSKFQIVGCMIGNFAGDGTFPQQIGIQVLTGSSDGYIITNNMLVANAGTGISDLGSGVNKIVTNNINV
jgi:hypothetical protein